MASVPRCHYCRTAPGLTKDHVIPRSRVSDRATYFTVPACGPCNHKRANKAYAPFAYDKGVDPLVIVATMDLAISEFERVRGEPIPERDLNAFVAFKKFYVRKQRRELARAADPSFTPDTA